MRKKSCCKCYEIIKNAKKEMQNKAACDILCINHLYEVKDMKKGLWIAVLSMGGVIAAIGSALIALGVVGVKQADDLDNVKF